MHKALEVSHRMSTMTLVALIPDMATMAWHHAREELLGQELLGRIPKVKGAYLQCDNGNRVWCIWSRFFGNTETEGNTLTILRMVVEGERSERSVASLKTANSTQCRSPKEDHVKAVTAILQAAQAEAESWQMNSIQVWNPSQAIVAAAKRIEPSSQVIHRDGESIASLRWHCSEFKAGTRIGWVGNEKYGWC